MSSRKSLFFLTASASILQISLVLATGARAEEKSKSTRISASAPVSPELKKDMAAMYQKMADCMKTEKSQMECQTEVMKDCPVAKATGHCPLMEGMKGSMNKGNMKHQKM
ncbi:MAG: hypothetical protein K2X47_09945 [Bdellovibrionales bacterium]|nr:hypothetical protein [Bdellovibrionales bacterium]